MEDLEKKQQETIEEYRQKAITEINAIFDEFMVKLGKNLKQR